MARPYNLLICSALWRSLRLCARHLPRGGRFKKRPYCLFINILYPLRLCARFFIIFFSLIAQLFSIFG